MDNAERVERKGAFLFCTLFLVFGRGVVADENAKSTAAGTGRLLLGVWSWNKWLFINLSATGNNRCDAESSERSEKNFAHDVIVNS